MGCKFFGTIVLAGCIGMGSLGFALIADPAHAKIYVNQDAITIHKRNFTVKTPKGLIKTKAIRVDKQGTYVFLRDVIVE